MTWFIHSMGLFFLIHYSKSNGLANLTQSFNLQVGKMNGERKVVPTEDAQGTFSFCVFLIYYVSIHFFFSSVNYEIYSSGLEFFTANNYRLSSV